MSLDSSPLPGNYLPVVVRNEVSVRLGVRWAPKDVTPN